MNSDVAINTFKLNAKSDIDVKLALSILRSGGIVALPTETVYGLAANALLPINIKKIFDAKKRPYNNPLILHTHDLATAQLLFADLEPKTKHRLNILAQAFWPGPLTIIAPKAPHIPLEATGGLDSVAVRVPQSEVTLGMLRQLSFPLVMPSANLSTRPSPTTADHVLKTLCGRIDAVLDDGPCAVGIESTVVRIDEKSVTILRPGHIKAEDLRRVLDEDVVQSIDHEEKPTSPGQAYLHYAPKVKEVVIIDKIAFSEAWHSEEILVARECDIKKVSEEQGTRELGKLSLGLSDDPAVFAQQIYGALYRCEDFPDKRVFILLPEAHGGDWQAIEDRVIRAAGLTQRLS